MSQLSLCLCLVIVLVASIEASNTRPCLGRCTSSDMKSSRVVCVRDTRSNICTKLRPCQLREKNCRRRDLGLEQLRESCLTRCRNIAGGSGSSGQCAKKLRTTRSPHVRKECTYRHCVDDKRASCWRNRNSCILATRCDATRRNCLGGPQNQWVRTSDWRCQGNVLGGGARQCRQKN